MAGIAEITSNYWYWSFTPTAVNSVRDKQLSQEAILFMLCQDTFAELNEEMRVKGLSLSGLDVHTRAELANKLQRCPISFRYMIGLN